VRENKGQSKLIDLVTVRLDTATDSYLVTLPSLRLSDVRIDPEMVAENERMLMAVSMLKFSWNMTQR